MNRRHLTIMSIDYHHAAAREMATIHRSVAGFENAIIKIFEDTWRVGRSARWVRDRIRRNLKQVHKSLDRIQTGMEEVQTRTLAGDEQSDSCWRETVKAELSATVEHVTGVLELDQHVAAARALGPAKPALDRFLDIISLRRHLPVRIMDYALDVDHLIHILRCEMEDFQFYTLQGRGIPWVNCWLGPSNHFEIAGAGIPDRGPAASEPLEAVTVEVHSHRGDKRDAYPARPSRLG
jgi:hypothetical protein